MKRVGDLKMVDMNKIMQYRSERICINKFVAEYLTRTTRDDYKCCLPCDSNNIGDCQGYTSMAVFTENELVRLAANVEKGLLEQKIEGDM